MTPLAFLRSRLPQPLLGWQADRRWRDSRDGGDPAVFRDGERVPFRCNLCGGANAAPLASLTREAPSCGRCGSNVRFRAMVYLVTREVLGNPAALPELTARKDIVGVGLSDAPAYAGPLAKKFSYRNTFYHTQPHLDISNVDDEHIGRYDFLIASDVFEHVLPPVGQSFVNARRMLKPGGKFIFSVPFNFENDTLEHFPELHDWSLDESDGHWTLANRTLDGREQRFDDLVFHGGPGSTLEMRLFSRAALEREFAAAGFARMRVADESWLPYGIHWPVPWSVPMVAYT